MSLLVPIALLGWIPLVLALFSVMPARRAVLVAFLLAWLFLPIAGYEFQGLPNFTKMSATSMGVLLGITLFDARRLAELRWAWHDLPMLTWLAVPMASSLHNGLGVYDGISAVFEQAITWGVPYYIGRLYFSNLAGLRELAAGIFIGGLIYVPLCLYEIRMSPQLHTLVYGFHQHIFQQSARYGGWRPTVFMQHGLAVGMWMAVASLLGVWLWQTRALRRVYSVPMSLLVPPLLVTTVMCKSIGALGLLVGGVGALAFAHMTRTARVMCLLVAVAPIYLTARIGMGWDAMNVVDAIAQVQSERAASLEVRLINERYITQQALAQPLFGWGRWGGYRDVDELDGKVVTDSLWIITLGQTGVVGLVCLTVVIVLPAVLLMYRTGMRGWHWPELAPAAGLAVMLLLFMIDSMFNSMLNPIYLLAGGGLAGLDAVQIRRGLQFGN